MKFKEISLLFIARASMVFCIAIILTGCNFAPGMNPYSERYEFNISSTELIRKLEKFKKENKQYNVPQIDLKDHYDNNSTVVKYYHVYLYYKREDQILHIWVTNDLENKNKSYLNFVGINQGIQLGNWKEINNDFSKTESSRLKSQFEKRVLKNLGLPYSNKGNTMQLL